MTPADQNVQAFNKEVISRHWEEIWNQDHLDRISTFHASDFSNFGIRQDLDQLRQIIAA